MGQLGELAKKLKGEQAAPSKTYVLEGDGLTPEERQAKAQEEAKRKEAERATTVAAARVKSEASMKGLAKAASRK